MTAAWRKYAEDRGFTPVEVLGELIRSWDGGRVPSGAVRPNRPSEVDERQAVLRAAIVAACDALEARKLEQARRRRDRDTSAVSSTW